MNDVLCDEVNVAEQTALEKNSRQTDRIPDFRFKKRKLALNQSNKQKNIIYFKVDTLLLVYRYHLVQSHQNINLQPLYFLLPE